MANVKTRSGFTLLEAILGLFILLCISILVQLTLQTVRQHRFDDLTPTSDWFLFIEELESNQHGFAVINVKADRLSLIDTVNDERYELVNGKCLYLRGRRGGYMPILLNYRPGTVAYRRIDSRRVKIEARTKDGAKHCAVAKFAAARKRNPRQHSNVNDLDGCNDNQFAQSPKTTKRKPTY